MSKHTKGPWVVKDNSGLPVAVVADSRDYAIAVINNHDESKGDDEKLANARLIAAAPELLDILEAFIDPISATMELRVKALAIIKKAKGKE